mmetsp:Transcript_45517/g.75623  ORF Transcript_45517/g.75623 Transcript_45517/m.75623 type:complete len:229 (-) Transcript_45517:369-1055(-)
MRTIDSRPIAESTHTHQCSTLFSCSDRNDDDSNPIQLANLSAAPPRQLHRDRRSQTISANDCRRQTQIALSARSALRPSVDAHNTCPCPSAFVQTQWSTILWWQPPDPIHTTRLDHSVTQPWHKSPATAESVRHTPSRGGSAARPLWARQCRTRWAQFDFANCCRLCTPYPLRSEAGRPLNRACPQSPSVLCWSRRPSPHHEISASSQRAMTRCCGGYRGRPFGCNQW